jgi:hypothetical protein
LPLSSIKDWSMTTLKEKLIRIGAKVVSHGRYVAFQMAEVAIPRNLFADILRMIAELRPLPGHVDSLRGWVLRVPTKTMREVCLDNKKLAANRLSTGVRQPPNCIGSQRDGLRLENRRRRT